MSTSNFSDSSDFPKEFTSPENFNNPKGEYRCGTESIPFSPKQPLFGFCPKCHSPLVYNSKNKQIVCLEFNCGFSRDYTSEDRKKVDEAAREAFITLDHWNSVYGNSSSLDDKLKAKEILKQINSEPKD